MSALVQQLGYVGEYNFGVPLGPEEVVLYFNTHSSAGVPTSLLGTPTVVVVEDSAFDPNFDDGTDDGLTLEVDVDGGGGAITGVNRLTLNMAAGPWATDEHMFHIFIKAGTVGGQSVAGTLLCSLSFSKLDRKMILHRVNALSGDDGVEAFRKSTNAIIQGLTAAGTLSTTQATTNLTLPTANQAVGRRLVFVAGAVAKEVAVITAYNPTGGLLTWDPPLTSAPIDGVDFIIV